MKMAKSEYQFEDFLANVSEDNKDFVKKVHESLTRDDYKINVESKASGFFASYSHLKTKRSIMNFLFRKKGLLVRIYGDNCGEYAYLLNKLPDNIVKQIDKTGVCKRLINPQDCNAKCVMGYDFYIGDKHYQKCRNSRFCLEVDSESIPFLTEMIENESKARLTAE
jgi:hypothetical protein